MVWLRLGTVASRVRTTRYERSLRPCAARFPAAQDITGIGINHLEPAYQSARTLSPPAPASTAISNAESWSGSIAYVCSADGYDRDRTSFA